MVTMTLMTTSNNKHRPYIHPRDFHRWIFLLCMISVTLGGYYYLSRSRLVSLSSSSSSSSSITITSTSLGNFKKNDTTGGQHDYDDPQDRTTSSKSKSKSKSRRDPLSCAGLIGRFQSSRHPTVRLVAMDFDKTIVDIHTGGRWNQDSALLVSHVRPSFQCFLSHLLLQHQSPIPIAITTFSNQKELIQQVLQQSLMDYNHGNNYDTFSTIPIFGGDDLVKGYSEGKQSQLFLAMQHYNDDQKEKKSQPTETTIIIAPSSTLLIDDDVDNIKVARNDGYQTLLYLPTRVHGS
jgi:hypothetical protein